MVAMGMVFIKHSKIRTKNEDVWREIWTREEKPQIKGREELDLFFK